MSNTKIEWTEKTWNPVTGCTKISPGCKHCYAERMSRRLVGRFGYPSDNPFSVTTHPDRLIEPLRWKKPSMIFVCSMGDLFHDDVQFEYIAAVFGVMVACPQHTFQVLTKRPERALEWFQWYEYRFEPGGILCATEWLDWITPWTPEYESTMSSAVLSAGIKNKTWPLPNVWVGVTAEDQERADERIPILLQIPAAVRFVSCEPLLGPIDFMSIPIIRNPKDPMTERMPWNRNPLIGGGCDTDTPWKVDWVITGGEGGPGALPMHPSWPRSIRDQCIAANIPFFFKKWGRYAPINGEFSKPGDLIHYREIDTDPVSMTTDKKRQVHQGKLDGAEWHQYPK